MWVRVGGGGNCASTGSILHGALVPAYDGLVELTTCMVGWVVANIRTNARVAYNMIFVLLQ